ncbi:maleylpyruvate isomerase N-terminal domain-containing protein [Micromonospora sp. CPCC 205371]|nr:maleylpyruvate isomerase N-terminal domain-containing protein [Micromonospora sp. CPCC 205371]
MIYAGLPTIEFAQPGTPRDHLVAAILSGTDTSPWPSIGPGGPLPQVGDRGVLVGSAGEPLAVLEVASADGSVADRFRVVSLIPGAAEVAVAFRAEAAALSNALRAIPDEGWEAPTCCPPWTVRDEFAHTAVAVSRTLEMLAQPAPPGPPVTAAGYFVADRRFDQAVNAARVDSAQEFAASQATSELLDWFDQQRHAITTAVDEVPGDRLVTTRHGDPMRLTDFQVTRVFELAVHGIDLADALGVPPWLTPEATAIVDGLLLGTRAPQARDVLGTDRAGLIRYATGRTPLTAAERDELDRLGITWLTLSP